ncbi:amidohydrolase family protein [Kitasatospora sp. NPDC050543]|uniref:amidohydrolase family protein n=1 Tax=Kitasatospora sp. NPDC050543 TaxID=3364054 RepID=UPI0037AA0088
MDDVEGSAPGPRPARATLSRRRFLQAAAATAGVAGVTVAGPARADGPAQAPARTSVQAQAPARRTTLSFTTATNGAATLAPSGEHLVAEVQSVLWSVPRRGGDAVALTPPDLEPTRPVHSPDGRSLAVCAYRGGGFHLWTLAADGSGLRQLTDGPWDDRAPSWSPDGRRIAFCSERGGDPVAGSPYRIWTVDVHAGTLTQLTGLPAQQGPLQDAAWEDFDPVWSPDGERVLFVRGRVTAAGTLEARTIAAVPASGAGAVTVVHTEPAPGASIMTPALSPAGRLAHLRTTAAPAASCTLVVDGLPVPLAGDLAPVPPRWTGEQSLLLTVDGTFRIVRTDTGEQTELIPLAARMPVERPGYRMKDYDWDSAAVRPVRGIHLPALSPDGRQVAFAALNALWLADVPGTATGTGTGRPRRLVQAPPTRYLHGPSWSPDGRSLLYADDRGGLFAIRRHDPATGAEQVLAEGGRVFPALSPDGTRLACLDLAGNLLVRDLAAGTEHVLAAPMGGGGLPGRPSWSPDGRHLALCDRNRLNRRFREGYNLVRIVDAATGADRLHAVAEHTSISDRYACGPVWSPAGRHLAYVAESALWLLPVLADGTPDGEPLRLTDESADHPSWSGDGRTLLYQSAGRLRLLTLTPDGDSAPVTAPAPAPVTVRVALDYRRPAAVDTVVHAGRLWDGTGETVREDVDITVRAGRITEIAAHRAGRRTGRLVDASQRTVIPGLWDTHTHPWPYTYGGRQSALQLAYGITTAVSLGGFAYEQARLREAVAAGELTGPRQLITGELLDGPRVAYSMGRAHRTREGLRRSLERAAALEWDFVKTYVRAPAWLMAEAARFAQQRLGVRSGSHLCSPGLQSGQDLTTHLQATQRLEYGHAITAGGRSYQDVAEIYAGTDFHLVATPFTALPLLGADPSLAADPRVTTLMPPWDAQLVQQLSGVAPTAEQLATLELELAVYRRVLAGGGLVALGTDQPLVPVGLHLHLALRALHASGLSPAQALRTATALPARVFGADRDLGTVEPGKLADLTVIDGDPFRDFATLIRTAAVLRGGVVQEQSGLVEAFAAPDTARGAVRRAGQADTDWLAVGRRMREGGCCGSEPADWA